MAEADKKSNLLEDSSGEHTDLKKIEIAVRFLQNSKVASTDKERKVTFLKSKGLNDEEISIALKKAEYEIAERPVQDDKSWSFFDYMKYIVLGTGILSATNYAYKAYILPYVAHEMKDDHRIELLTESLQILKDDIKQNTYELNGTLKQIQNLLDEQQKLLINVAANKSQSSDDGSNLNEVKSELATLKSLMLSKRQFPPAPFSVQGSTEIPAWQQISNKPQQVFNGSPPETQDEDEMKLA